VKASDTWLRARRGEVRGALLLLWAESWQQTPCGSLPNDDELIALLLDMTGPTFAKQKAVLLRGWTLADDGRLYHETITARVLDMLAKRAKDAKRSADRRARSTGTDGSSGEVTSASRVTNAGVPPKSDTKHQAPSTSNSVPDGTGGAAADGKRAKTPAERRKSELWAGMKTLLVESGECPDLKSAGAVITKTITRFDEATALAAIDATLHARPAGAIAYLEGVCQQAAGLRQNKQEVLESGNLAAAERFALEPDHATH
jgi:hypothetical protein